MIILSHGKTIKRSNNKMLSILKIISIDLLILSLILSLFLILINLIHFIGILNKKYLTFFSLSFLIKFKDDVIDIETIKYANKV